MNTKNTNTNTNMKKSTPDVKAPEAKVTKAVKPTKATKAVKPVAKAERPKLTAAYIKEMVAKGLSPLTGKPIRHYSRTGKRYTGKEAVTAKPVTEKAKAPTKAKAPASKVKTAKVEAPITEKVEVKMAEATVTKPEASKPAIPVLKAKKGVKKA